MAAAIMRWWQGMHNGGEPTEIVPPIPANSLLDDSDSSAFIDVGTGKYLIDI